MARNITTVTHPDGTVSKRTSARAVYTHTIVRGPVDPAVRAAYLTAQADDLDALAARNEAAVAAGQTVLRNRGFGRYSDDVDSQGRPNYDGHEMRLTGSAAARGSDGKVYPVEVRSNSKGEHQHHDYSDTRRTVTIVDAREAVIAKAARTAEAQREQAADLRHNAALWLAGTLTDNAYAVVRWSSREDLAVKASTGGEFAYYAKMGHEVTIVPVDA